MRWFSERIKKCKPLEYIHYKIRWGWELISGCIWLLGRNLKPGEDDQWCWCWCRCSCMYGSQVNTLLILINSLIICLIVRLCGLIFLTILFEESINYLSSSQIGEWWCQMIPWESWRWAFSIHLKTLAGFGCARDQLIKVRGREWHLWMFASRIRHMNIRWML